ncbi:MAG: glycoside hydrolase family 43 protein [Bacteroidales bacterium]|nr:glycoside hydrolase family 43 protein [Bacteroidales bacterium]
MIYRLSFILLAVILLSCQTQTKQETTKYPIHIDSICVHDPCILADPASKTYYLYGQFSPKKEWQAKYIKSKRAGVLAYKSRDLEYWSEPELVFEVPKGFWADSIDSPWAPEVHHFNNKYYLLVTFNDWNKFIEQRADRPPITLRRSQVLVADSPTGPFAPFSNEGSTPDGEMTLDATLWNENGDPWLVYCHEWIQVTSGLIKAVKLTPDLSARQGDPITLIDAGDVNWPKRHINYKNQGPMPGIVTDGPYFYKTKNGKLVMIWSSWGQRKYATAIAVSESGSITGPWKHIEEPILQDDRGHGMIFEDFDGRLLLAIHRYFRQPATRVQIWELEDTGDLIEVKKQVYGAI